MSTRDEINDIPDDEITVTVRAFPTRIHMSSGPQVTPVKSAPSRSAKKSSWPKENGANHSSEEKNLLSALTLDPNDPRSRSLTLAFGLRVMKELRALLRHENPPVPNIEAFVKILETIEIEDYLEHHHINGTHQLLRSFHHLLSEQRQIWKAFGVTVRGISRQDEIELLHLGLSGIFEGASEEAPMIPKSAGPRTIYILDAATFDQRAGLTTNGDSGQEAHDNELDYEILDCQPERLGYLERHREHVPVLYLSRKLTDSVRYLHYRSGTLKKPKKDEALIRKIGMVLHHFWEEAAPERAAI